MSPARLQPFVRMIAILAAGILFLCSCSEDTPTGGDDPEDLLPAYYIQQGPTGQATLVGWAKIPMTLDGPSTLLRASYFLEGHPFEKQIDIRWETGPADPHYDWDLGREGGPWLRASIDTDNERGGWGYVMRGWGELHIEAEFDESASMPLVFDPLSPLSHALLARAWELSEATESLQLEIIFISGPRARPQAVMATLHDEGESIQSGIPLRTFRLEAAGERFFTKCMLDHFPIPYSTWWESRQISLQFIGTDAPVFNTPAPDFPAPAGYEILPLSVASGDLQLGGERFEPDGDGILPVCLLLADAGPSDEQSMSLLGYLARELSEAGWLVHRPDKPGTGASNGSLDTLDLEGRRTALADLWQTLIDDPRTDPERRLIIGHGEGAALALEFAVSESTVDGVIALAPRNYDPTTVPIIPAADAATGDFIDFLGRNCFVGKYQDLRTFASADYLPDLDLPLAFYRGELDETLTQVELEMQAVMIEGLPPDIAEFMGLDHYFGIGAPTHPPAQGLIDEMFIWLNHELPPAP